MPQEKIRARCECPGCDDIECEAIASLTCDHSNQLTPDELRQIGWRTSNGAWLCPACSRGLPGRPPPRFSDSRYRKSQLYTHKKSHRKPKRAETEPANHPVWQERGNLLITYLGTGPKNWDQLTSWGRCNGFDEAMVRNVMASVDDSIIYRDGLWRAVVARGKFTPVTPSPGCTLGARIAMEHLSSSFKN